MGETIEEYVEDYDPTHLHHYTRRIAPWRDKGTELRCNCGKAIEPNRPAAPVSAQENTNDR